MRVASFLRCSLLNPGIYAGVLLSLLLLALAYQIRPSYDVTIGSPTDAPLLDSFYDSERLPNNAGLPYTVYRWTHDNRSTITFMDVGRQDFDVVLTVNGSRPPGQPAPQLRVKTDNATLLDVQPPPVVQDYAFTILREQVIDGSFTLVLETNSFKPPGDPRDLGIVVTHIRAVPGANPDRFVEPPISPTVALTGAVALLSLLLALLGWGAGGVFVGGSAVGLLAAGLLVFDRLWLTSRGWYWAWPQSLAAAVIAAICLIVGDWLMRHGGVVWTPLQCRSLVTLVALVFAVRLAGQLHPSIFVFDLGFHVNILNRVSSGDLLFTTQPAEFGIGHSTFYLPTPYLFIEPVRLVVNDPRMAIRLITVATGTLGALPIFYLVSCATGRGRAGLLAASIYLMMPMSVIIFSWGITPNIFGEFFALCALAVAVGGAGNLVPNRLTFWLLVALLTVTILSHPGVLVLTSVAFGAMGLIWLLARRTLNSRRIGVGLLCAFGAAIVLAIVLYYRHFIPQMLSTLGGIQKERASGAGSTPLIVGGSVEDSRLGLFQREVHSFREWLMGGLEGFWSEARAYYRVWPLAGALLGYISTFRAGRTASTNRGLTDGRLVLAAGAWTLSVVLFAFVGWATNLFVRYMLFALPIIAIGCGLLLSRLWGRSGPGRWLVLGLVVLFAVEALAFWQNRINFAFR